MHCLSNPLPTYTLKRSHSAAKDYCRDELIKDSIELRARYGRYRKEEPLEIRKCDVRGYASRKKLEGYKSQIFFDTPNVHVESKPLILNSQRPQTGLVSNPNYVRRPSESTESQMGSISYQSVSDLDPPVHITLKLKSQHTNRNQLKKFQDKLIIKQLPNNMVEVSGRVPLKVANLFKTIFQGSEFHLERARQ